MSVALEICRVVQEKLTATQLAGLVSVAVDVGDDSGLEPANLEFCLESLLAQPPFPAARPVLCRHPGDVLRVSYLEVDE